MKEYEPQYRHEFKYICSRAELEYIRCCLEGMLDYDEHTGPGHRYTIRSLYFDTYDNRCFYENENGIDPREKYRIRMYNQKTDYMKLELKRKECGKTLKQSCEITEQQVEDIFRGRMRRKETNPSLLDRFMLESSMKLLRPVVIVEYDRVPFVFREGNVRITLDMNIRSSSDVKNFLGGNLPFRYIQSANQHVLEVKYDEYMPEFIKRFIQLENLQQTAFSKYYLCRKYTIGGRKL